MKRNISKLIALFTGVIMLLSCVPVFAAPASGSCGDNVSFTYNKATGEVVISGTGAMKDYSVLEDGAYYSDYSPFCFCDDIKSVVIGEGVTSVGNWSFAGCKKLESVSLPSTMKRIGKRAFIGCISIKEIAVPERVEEINDSAFYNCAALTAIDIPGSVKTIGDNTFYHCTALKTVNLAEGVETISEYAFSECPLIESIALPESLKEIEGCAFSDCTSLKGLTIPKNVEKIGYNQYYHVPIVFNCPSITTLKVDPENTAYDSRNNCNAIIETKSNILINGCCNTVIPDTVTEIYYRAFCGCTKLKSIEIPKSVQNIGGEVFMDCSNLEQVNLPKGLKAISYGLFENCKKLKSIEIPNTVELINARAFFECDSFTSLTIPDSVTKIHAAVWGCDKLKSVKLSKNLTEMNRTFKDCTSLKKIEVPGKVEKVEALCEGCTALETVKIPASVKSISFHAFKGCKNLKEFIVDKNNEKYSSKDGVVYTKNKTILVLYPNGKKATTFKIPSSVKKIKQWAFCEGGTNLKTLIIPTSVKTIEYYAFGNKTGIKSIKYEGTLMQWQAIEVGAYDADYDSEEGEYIDDRAYDSYYLYEEPQPFDAESFTDPYGLFSTKGRGNDALDKIRVYCTNAIREGKHVYYKKDSKLTKHATFKAAGEREYKCCHCSKKIKVTVSKLGTPKLASVTKGSKSFTAKWNKVSSVDGYQIQYSTSKSFKNAKKKSTKNASLTVKNLKTNKKYYVRIRAYKKINGKTQYSKWSDSKSVTTK
ncbi:MAG: fibronectin type III domain-containing protein [Ruminococcaceae bacterium]|nr:fibronectin type III domain-containing protein [Oscillospiraceae bacterium]